MNLKEAIELIDPEIEFDLLRITQLKNSSCSNNPDCHEYHDLSEAFHFLLGRLAQMKREVLRTKSKRESILFHTCGACDDLVTKEIDNELEALNILINHLEEVLK